MQRLARGEVKAAILGKNGAGLHNLETVRRGDLMDEHKTAWGAAGYLRSTRAYGYVRNTA
jgi:hypothetical protein